MNHIEPLWNSFLEEVLPDDCPPMRLIQLRRVFYSGACSTFEIIMQKLADPTYAQDEGEKFLNELAAEVQRFMSDLEEHKV